MTKPSNRFVAVINDNWDEIEKDCFEDTAEAALKFVAENQDITLPGDKVVVYQVTPVLAAEIEREIVTHTNVQRF
jgi:hypothetical protein